MTERGWRLARMEDVPAVSPADDPEFWRPWTSDPAFHRGWHSVGRHLGVRAFGVNAARMGRVGTPMDSRLQRFASPS